MTTVTLIISLIALGLALANAARPTWWEDWMNDMQNRG